MRVLLDNCVNRRFAALITGHEVTHALDRGWDKLSNGLLLSACEEAGYNAIVTVDKNMRFQQNLENRELALIVLDLSRIDLPALRTALPTLQSHLDRG